MNPPLAYHPNTPQLRKLRLESGFYTAVQLHFPINIRVRLEREANRKIRMSWAMYTTT
jgi:hypothetical protein